MTIIAVKKYDDYVELGSDGRIVTENGIIVTDSAQKIHYVKNDVREIFWVGIAGDLGTQQALLSEKYDFLDYLEDDAMVIRDRIADFHKDNQTKEDEWISLIIVAEATLNVYEVCGTSVQKIEYCATLGTGAVVARGALEQGATVKEALEITKSYMSSCGGDFYIRTIEKPEENKEAPIEKQQRTTAKDILDFHHRRQAWEQKQYDQVNIIEKQQRTTAKDILDFHRKHHAHIAPEDGKDGKDGKDAPIAPEKNRYLSVEFPDEESWAKFRRQNNET